MVLGKPSVPGCQNNLNKSTALVVGAGEGYLDFFFSHLLLLTSFSLFLRDGPKLSQSAVNLNQPTNQPSTS